MFEICCFVIVDTVSVFLPERHINTVSNLSDTSLFRDTFLGNSSRVIQPELLLNVSHNWLLYIMFFLIAILAFINFTIPNKLSNIFTNVFLFKKNNLEFNKGLSFSFGIVVSIFFFINFLLSVTVFFYLIVQYFLPTLFVEYSNLTLFLTILSIISIYLIGKRFIIWLTNLILGQPILAKLHLTLENNTEYLTGVLLLPFLLLFLFTSSTIWLLFSSVIIVIFLVLKWVLIFILGLKLLRVYAFHLFLYLCTLEMVPLLVVIKLLGYNNIL